MTAHPRLPSSAILAVAVLFACNGRDDSPGTDSPTGDGTETAWVDPGTRPLQRVNATEYNAIVRDLFETSQAPGDYFPPDEISYGFDNIAAALTVNSTHVELWETAADSILDELFDEGDEETLSYSVQAEGAGVSYLGTGELFDTTNYAVYEGSISVVFSLEYDGTFDVTVSAFGRPAAGISPTMEMRVDGELVGTILVSEEGEPVDFVVSTFVNKGLHSFEVSLLNPSDDLKRALIVDRLQVKGPTDPEVGRPPGYDALVPCAPDGAPTRACAAEVIPTFGRLAWRRPLTQEEVDWALGLYDAADQALLSEAECLAYAFKGILMSAEFLYRVESDPADGDRTIALDGYQLATRLAAFVWSSTPDAELLDAASRGVLDTPEGVEAQLVRMMNDDRASALVDNLAGQWFSVRRLEETALDTVVYPGYSEELRESMVTELQILLEGFFREGQSLDEILTQQTTWVDQRLADLYQLPFAPLEGEWQPVSTAGTDRYGLFGTAGWLMANSRSNAPSAVKRGKWVMENLLCSPPPPPPPNVEGMVTVVEQSGSVREQEEAQRADDFCQTCHSQMDPLGWTLHGYAADGVSRTEDELGYAIDNVTTWDGVELAGPGALAAAVAADERLALCAVERTFIYAMGREVRLEDGAAIEAIVDSFVGSGQKFDALAKAIVTSDAFRMRGVPEEVE